MGNIGSHMDITSGPRRTSSKTEATAAHEADTRLEFADVASPVAGRFHQLDVSGVLRE